LQSNVSKKFTKSTQVWVILLYIGLTSIVPTKKITKVVKGYSRTNGSEVMMMAATMIRVAGEIKIQSF